MQVRARAAFRMFQQDPWHPGLQFKQIRGTSRYWSVRINDDFRAVGYRDGDEIEWYWIGGHDEYLRLVGRRL